ncbi:LysE/ArgO family amino acid transporter [Brachybacterium sp. JHP9]|uniref:LysE/ArgO family amino acid transporter n=1 Tax=Brachybacterium equifaecis TaxID=2910770 RepID=A0ABT0QX88_9MICO|nr:LysE/ArgO family amino acid transporter [Brachybacterium equifaecis]MCL6422231.1 LysE/ArgO family amino acid transporter [Brachybacterium equifaecis]
MTAALHGLLTGLSLIVAIGAQNVFVLRQGLRREHVLAVVTICALSDAVLIAAGVGGLGAVIRAVPWLVEVARWAGIAFLLVYAAMAARRALRPTGEALEVETAPAARGLAAVIGTALALTWLNPHVYLDTVLLLGSIASSHGEQRWWFAAGAMCASLLWFSALGFGARVLGRYLGSPLSWRILDAVVAATMVAAAIMLLLS